MDIDDLTDDDLDRLASKLAGRLPTGRHGDRIVTTRRQLLAAAAGGSIGVSALVKLGIDPATAQSAAGQVGTQSSPEDVFANALDVQAGAEFNGTDVSGVGSLSTGDVTVEPAVNTTLPLASGGSNTVNLTSQGGLTVGDRFVWSVVPESDPNNDFDIGNKRVRWVDSDSDLYVQFDELANAGGGTVRVRAWQL
jgi:hypothetical protein